MQNFKSLLLAACVSFALAACGGGGGSSSVPAPPGGGNGSQSQALHTDGANFLSVYNPDGTPSDLFAFLYADANIPLSVDRSAQSTRNLLSQPTPVPNTFKPNIAGGNATIATNITGANPTGTVQTVAALSTYRDVTGSCQCSNDVINGITYPPPYAATISNPSWNGGKSWSALASTEVLSTFLANKNGMPATSGTYTYAVKGDPGNTASFTIPNATVLPRQSAPTVAFNTPAAGQVTFSWTPAAGTNEYFLALLTHLKNTASNPIRVVGYVITDHTSVVLNSSDLYSKAPYNMFVIATDKKFVGSYFSLAQLPPLPDNGGQINFSMSQLTSFTTP